MNHTKINNMKALKYFLCFFYALTATICFGNNNVKVDSLVHVISNNLQKQVEFNDINRNKNQQHRNGYLLNIDVSSSEVTINNNCNWIDHTKMIDGSLIETDLQVPTSICELCEDFNGFNQNNSSLVEHYIVIVQFPRSVLKAGLTEGLESSDNIPEYMANNQSGLNYEPYKLLADQINERLYQEFDNTIFTQGRQHRIVTVQFRYDQVKNKDKILRKATSVTHRDSDSNFLKDKFAEYKTQIESTQEASQYIKNVMTASMNYWNGIVNTDADCADLIATLTSDGAKNYVETWCDSQNPDEHLGYIYAIAQYIDYLYYINPVAGDVDQSIEANDAIFSPSDYLANISQYTSYLEYLKNKLMESCGDGTNNEMLFNNVFFRAKNDIHFYEQLTVDERLCLLKNYIQFHTNTSTIEWTIESPFYEFKKIFQTALVVHSKEELILLVDGCKSIPDFLPILWGVCDNLWTLEGTEEKLVQIITAITYKINDLSPNTINLFDIGQFTGDKHMWKKPVWYAPCWSWNGHYRYDHAINSTTRQIETQQIEITKTFYGGQVDYEQTDNCQFTEETVESFNYDPFDLVGIQGADDVTFFTQCETDNCYNKFNVSSAFGFAWLLEKNADGESMDQFFTVLAIIGTVTGVTELAAALQAANYGRAAFFGWVVLSELAANPISQGFINNTLVLNYGPQEGQAMAQKINLILNINAGAAGVLQIGDALRSLAAYKTLDNAGDIPVNATDELLWYRQRCQNVVRQFQGKPGLLAKFLNDSPLDGHIVAKLMDIAGDELRLAVIGRVIDDGPEFMSFLNGASKYDEIVDNIKNIMTSGDPALIRNFTSIGPTKRLGLYTALENSPNPAILAQANNSNKFSSMLVKAAKGNKDIISKMSGWDDALTDALRIKIENPSYLGLVDEMVEFSETQNLFRHFQALFKTDIEGTPEWFYKFRLKRSHIVSNNTSTVNLPPNFLNVLDDIDLPVPYGASNQFNKMADLTDASKCGTAFDHEATSVFRTLFEGDNWSNTKLLPDYAEAPPSGLTSIKTELESIAGEFDVMLVDGKSFPTGSTSGSALDLRFFKLDDNGDIIPSGARGYDFKINKDTQYSTGQIAENNQLAGTFTDPAPNLPVEIYTRGSVQLDGTSHIDNYNLYFLDEPYSLNGMGKITFDDVVIDGQTEMRMYFKLTSN